MFLTNFLSPIKSYYDRPVPLKIAHLLNSYFKKKFQLQRLPSPYEFIGGSMMDRVEQNIEREEEEVPRVTSLPYKGLEAKEDESTV